MPGGAGGGKQRPPEMRLHRESRAGAVVYADSAPKSPFWRWARAVVRFFVAAFFLGLLYMIVGSTALSAVGQTLFWTLGTAAALHIVLLGPARCEVEPSRERKALVFRLVYLWGPPRERERSRPEVEAVALLGRERGGPYLQLKLLLADGRTVLVDQGKETERMEQMADDVGAALEMPVSRVPGPVSLWPGGRLSRLALGSSGVRWVDFDAGWRLAATWALCLGSLLLSAALLFSFGWELVQMGTTPPAADASSLVGHLVGVVFILMTLYLFVASAARLRLPRYLALSLSHQDHGVLFHRLGLFGGRREECLSAGEVAGVVIVCNHKEEAREVWLESPEGKRLFVDGAWRGGRIEELADELSRRLQTSVRQEVRALFWR